MPYSDVYTKTYTTDKVEKVTTTVEKPYVETKKVEKSKLNDRNLW